MFFCSQCFATLQQEARFCNFCGAKVEPKERQDPWIGRSLQEKYLLQKKLGTGSYGDVYQAKEANTGKVFAIKLLRRELLQNPQTTARFQREGIAASRLDHPNAMKVFDLGQAESGELYLVMELILGQSLKQRIEQGPLEPFEFFSIFLPLCDALDAAHQKGIIHRDIKPDNIMISQQEGRIIPKLLDFGLAGLLGEARLTLTGTVIGTPPYMAPEQWGGLKFTEKRSDVYALGVVAYRCLAGRLPFEAKSPIEWLKKHRFEAPPELRSVARWVPPGLSSSIMKTLEKLPSQRYQSATELKVALMRAQISLEPTVIGEEEDGTSLEVTSFRGPEENATRQLSEEGTSISEELPSDEAFASTEKLLLNVEEGILPDVPERFGVVQTGLSTALMRVLLSPNGTLLAAGSEGKMLRSSDSSRSWTALESGVNATLYSIWAHPRGEYIACGEGGLLLQSSDGKSWQRLTSPTKHTLYGIWGGNRGVFFAGEAGTLLRKSGEVLFSLKLGEDSLFHGCQSFFGDLFVVGKKGSIYRSTDYGFTWQPRPSPVKEDLHSICATRGELYTVGKTGRVLRSQDRGATWVAEPCEASEDLYDLWCSPTNELYAVGGRGCIVQRDAQTARWRLLQSPTRLDLFGLCGLQDGSLVIVGDAGLVLVG